MVSSDLSDTTLVHLIYIHGFNGSPSHIHNIHLNLQDHLCALIQPTPRYRIQSSLYPTYKSRKPISHATKNFMEWLSTQPPGPVILLAHSMGGLLAAEAATHASNNPDEYPGAKPIRIIGIVAFDVPFLGMHPHVVVSGIASLFDDDRPKEKKIDLQPDISIVDPRVTDDWDTYKRTLDQHGNFILTGQHPSMSRLSLTSTSSSTSSHHAKPQLLERAAAFLDTHENDPLVKWLNKHKDAPFEAGRQQIVERFQFGSCMFDPVELVERYKRLVARVLTIESTDASATSSLVPSPLSLGSSAEKSSSQSSCLGEHERVEKEAAKQARAEEKEWERQLKRIQKQRVAEEKALRKAEEGRSKPGRHFIVLPSGLGQVLGGADKWERVIIGGVDDEVNAHCGLFIRGKNPDYDGLVERVGQRVLSWCGKVCEMNICYA
ncbi:hypothetical protein FISHEDRAFT_41332 [Fistulina hepatica ATCC 64428]|nr:hypothetical protein FISHEDRAFT_41332 [Fistulina hepatica ATCC 64428]